MIARLFALKLFCAILLLPGCTTIADPRDLPNDCGIVAAEAYSRLKATSLWVRIISVKGMLFTEKEEIKVIYHVMTVYQYDAESHVMIYDEGGTAELPTNSRQMKDIAAALTKLADGRLIIFDTRFLSNPDEKAK